MNSIERIGSGFYALRVFWWNLGPDFHCQGGKYAKRTRGKFGLVAGMWRRVNPSHQKQLELAGSPVIGRPDGSSWHGRLGHAQVRSSRPTGGTPVPQSDANLTDL